MKYQTILQFIVLLFFANQVMANPEILRNDPKRPTAKISAALGVTQNQFIECFNNVNPAQGSNPTKERVHSNKKVLLSCLQKANSNITNDKLDSVMDANRPGGKQAQEPID